MNYETDERTINLKDMLYRVMKQWRRIIVGAVIIALLAGIYRFATTIIVILDPEKLAEAEDKYQILVDDYEATGERLKTRISNLRDNSKNQQEYNDKSVIMTIDPMNKWVGSFVIYVDSKYQIDPTLTYQNIDRTNRLLTAYAGYLTGGELYNEILEKTTIVDEIRFLTEILSFSVDSGSSSITARCIGKSDTDVREILELTKTGIKNKYNTIYSTIGDHSCEVLMESMYTTIDLDMDARQKANLQAIGDYAIAIGETNEELSEWEKEDEPKQEYGVWFSTKESIKFIIFGGIIGVFVMGIYYAVKYAMTATVKTDDDWEMLGIPVLAQIYEESSNKHFRKIDKWIDRTLGGKTDEIDKAVQCQLAANNLIAVLKDKDLSEGVLIGNMPIEQTSSIIDNMNSAGTKQTFRYAGDILKEPEAAQKLNDAAKVILMGHNGKTRIETIQKEQILLKAWGKEAIGVIVVE